MELKQKKDLQAPENPYAAPAADSAPEHLDFDPLDLISAPHGKRWIAFMIDRFVIFGVLFAVGVVGEISIELLPELRAVLDILNMLLVFGLPVLYHGLMEGSAWQATLGKRAMGLRVVNEHSGEQLTYQRSFGRALARTFISMFGLLNIVVLFSKMHRGVWDMMASTRVVLR